MYRPNAASGGWSYERDLVSRALGFEKGTSCIKHFALAVIGLFHSISIHPLWMSFNYVEGGVLSEL